MRCPDSTDDVRSFFYSYIDLGCYNAKVLTAEVYTHDTKLKKRLLKYAAKFPELCQQTDDDEQGGLRFEIDKSRISIRLTAPYSEGRRAKASRYAKQQNIANLRNK